MKYSFLFSLSIFSFSFSAQSQSLDAESIDRAQTFEWAVEQKVYPSLEKSIDYTILTGLVNGLEKKYTSLDRVPSEEWNNLHYISNRAHDVVQNQIDLANGKYQIDSTLRSGITDTSAAAAGLIVGLLGGGPGGGALAAALTKSGSNAVLDSVQTALGNSKQLPAQNYVGDARKNVMGRPVFVGEAADFQRKCGASKGCEKVYNALMGATTGNLNESFAQKSRQFPTIKNDASLGAQREAAQLVNNKLARTQADLGRALSENEKKAIIKVHTTETQSKVSREVNNVQQAAETALEKTKTPEAPKVTFSRGQIQDTDAAVRLGSTLAYMIGEPKVGQAISQIGGMTVGFMNNLSALQNKEMSQFAFSASTAAMVLNGMQMLQGMNGKKGPSFEESVMKVLQQISEQLQQLQKTVVIGFQQNNATLVISTNQLSTQLEQLGKITAQTLEVGYQILEASQQKILNEHVQAEGILKTEFQQTEKECLLDQTSAYQSCLNKFMNDAVYSSQYRRQVVRSLGVLEFGDRSFPFLNHLGNLLSYSGNGEAQVEDLVRPQDWYRNANAYTTVLANLSQEQSSQLDWRATKLQLDSIIASGQHTRQAIFSLNRDPRAEATKPFALNIALHEKKTKEYFESGLWSLYLHTNLLDGKNTWGKNLLQDLSQPLPANKVEAFQEMFVTRRHKGYVPLCAGAPDENFTFPDGSFTNQSGFFARQNDIGRARQGWNRSHLMELPFPSIRPLISVLGMEYVWADLLGLGKVELCIEKYRPTVGTIGSGTWNEYHNRTAIAAEVEVQVRFTPTDNTARKHYVVKTIQFTTNTVIQAFRFVEKGSYVFPGFYGKWAREVWSSKRLDSGATERDTPTAILHAPFVENLNDSSATKFDRSNLRTTLNEQYRREYADQTAQLSDEIRRSRAYVNASLLYKSYLAMVTIGLGQITTSELSMDKIFNRDFVASPEEFLSQIISKNGEAEKISLLIKNYTNRSSTYFKDLAYHGHFMPVDDPQTLPPAVRAIDQMIERLTLWQRILEARKTIFELP